jgi:ABC-type transporter Mla subunit MlaD
VAEHPWDRIARTQRAAAARLVETLGGVVELGRTGITHPDEAMRQVSSFAAAVADFAGSSAQPLEMFLTSQRQLAETMKAYAALQRQLADVLDTAAANHVAIVQALELMTSPMTAVAHRLRGEDEPPDEEV